MSKKTIAKEAVNALYKLTNPLNCFLAACYDIFNSVDSLEYNPNTKVDSYLSVFNSQFTSQKATNRKHKRIQIYLFIKKRLNILFKCLTYKEYRIWLFNVLTDKDWYKRKLIQFGIKK